MKAFLKRYAAPVCALICVLALAGAWTGVRLSADAGTYRLRDVEGDASYLDNIHIAMRLEDAAHTQHITLENGVLSHSYEYLTPLRTPDEILHYESQAFVEDESADVKTETSTTLESSDETYELWVTHLTRAADSARISVSVERYGMASHTDTSWAQVVTDVTVSGEGYPFVFNLERETTIYKNQTSAQGEPLPDTTYETPFSYTEASADPVSDMGYTATPLYAKAPDGTVYFTPSLSPYYGGTSAIYRVDEWGDGTYYSEPSATVDGYPCYPNYYARAVGSVTKLAEFPAKGLRTVALDVVNDRLCLLLVADGMLTLRVYGLDGALEYEAALFAAGPEKELTSTLFSNQSGGATMLCYYLQDPTYGSYWDAQTESDAKLICVRLGDTAELMSVLTGRNALVRAAFINGHWVLAEVENAEVQFDENYDPASYSISVLDAAGETLYKGEIETDMAEDAIQHQIATGAERPGEFTVSRWLYFDDITEG